MLNFRLKRLGRRDGAIVVFSWFGRLMKVLSNGRRLLVGRLCLVSLLGVIGCDVQSGRQPSNDGGLGELVHDGMHRVLLTSRLISLDDILGQPRKITAVESMLLVSDMQGQPYLHLFDRDSGKLTMSAGKRGKGPGDFYSAPSFVPSLVAVSRPRVWLFDDRNSRLLGIDLSGRPTPEMLRDAIIVPLPSRSVLEVVEIKDGQFFASEAVFDSSGAVDRLQWIQFNRSGARVARRVPMGLGTSGELTINNGMAYDHTLCAQPGGRRIAVAYLTAGRLDIVDVTTHRHSKSKVPLPFLPALGVEPGQTGHGFWSGNPDIRAGYIDCFGTAGRIYALFSGRRVREFPQREPANCRFVHVFDWDGNFLEVLELDHRARAITMDRGGQTLFFLAAAEQDERPMIFAASVSQVEGPFAQRKVP